MTGAALTAVARRTHRHQHAAADAAPRRCSPAPRSSCSSCAATQRGPRPRRRRPTRSEGSAVAEAFGLLRESKQIQLIAVVIGFGSLGAALIDQQLNMAAEAFKGRGETDSISVFLAQVQLLDLSAAAFVIQVWLTPQDPPLPRHRLRAAGAADEPRRERRGDAAQRRALGSRGRARARPSLRYTVDKTTREILFLPLPSDAAPGGQAVRRRHRRPDVARPAARCCMLVLVQPWGLGLALVATELTPAWSLTALWIFMAFRARRELPRGVPPQHRARATVEPAELRLSGADLSTVETLVQELSHPAAGARHLRDRHARVAREGQPGDAAAAVITSRRRSASGRCGRSAKPAASIATQWVPQVRRALGDPHAGVRAAALRALGAIAQEDAANAGAADARRSRSADPRDRGGRAGGQRRQPQT